ncbi:phospholipid scramblase 1-like isoform X2 [Tubulanus polymorphus]|uniref:phospholipid scramblase 1-like isoform X2 n=1 Tax=Tubulanus polymorphus TaxID=672921 RepID=UPI003DA544FB
MSKGGADGVAVVAQPTQPQMTGGVPPGLEYLAQLDQIIIKQMVELLEVFTGWECKNKYKLMNSMDQQSYYAFEMSDACMRMFCGSGRGFEMHVVDNAGAEVIRIHRPFKCCAGCCWCADTDCCAQELHIEAPVGNVIGYVRQLKSGWRVRLALLDANKTHIFTLEGPCCICQAVCCRGDVDFPIFSAADPTKQVCNIAKQWNGCVKDAFTDAVNLGITFPIDLDVKLKAVLIGAAFLLDFMLFERDNN